MDFFELSSGMVNAAALTEEEPMSNTMETAFCVVILKIVLRYNTSLDVFCYQLYHFHHQHFFIFAIILVSDIPSPPVLTYYHGTFSELNMSGFGSECGGNRSKNEAFGIT